MKRPLIIRLIVCLLLGAATTVAVALAGLRFDRYTLFGQWRIDPALNTLFEIHRPDGVLPPARSTYDSDAAWIIAQEHAYVPQPGNELLFWMSLHTRCGIFVDEMIVVGAGQEKHLRERSTRFDYDLIAAVQKVRLGWPMRAFNAQEFTSQLARQRFAAEEDLRLLVAGSKWGDNLFRRGMVHKPDFPLHTYRPIWFGFFVNTIIYATVFFLALFPLRALRRAIRARRGHCPKCGYDLRGAPVDGCPECGWNRK